MLSNFRTYQMALSFHRSCAALPRVPGYLRDQLNRASSSVALNLAEGSGKATARDQVKYYCIARGSLRECQAVLELLNTEPSELKAQAHRLGGSLHVLIVAMTEKA